MVKTMELNFLLPSIEGIQAGSPRPSSRSRAMMKPVGYEDVSFKRFDELVLVAKTVEDAKTSDLS